MIIVKEKLSSAHLCKVVHMSFLHSLFSSLIKKKFWLIMFRTMFYSLEPSIKCVNDDKENYRNIGFVYRTLDLNSSVVFGQTEN